MSTVVRAPGTEFNAKQSIYLASFRAHRTVTRQGIIRGERHTWRSIMSSNPSTSSKFSACVVTADAGLEKLIAACRWACLISAMGTGPGKRKIIVSGDQGGGGKVDPDEIGDDSRLQLRLGGIAPWLWSATPPTPCRIREVKQEKRRGDALPAINAKKKKGGGGDVQH
jgi:hypothetical protein